MENATDYEWNGDIYDQNESLVGLMNLISHSGALFGQINIGERAFTIEDIGKNNKGNRITYLIERNFELLKDAVCGTDHGDNEESEFSQQDHPNKISNHKTLTSVCPTIVRVLVLYTSAADNPSRDYATIDLHLSTDDELEIVLIDQSGKRIKAISNRVSYAKGEHNVGIDISDLRKGLYYIVISGNSIDKTMQIIKL